MIIFLNEKEEERKEGNVSTTRKEMIEPRWKKEGSIRKNKKERKRRRIRSKESYEKLRKMRIKNK